MTIAHGPDANDLTKMLPKKRQHLGSGTLGTHTPGEMSVEDDDFVQIAGRAEAVPNGRTACATLTDRRRAEDAPRTRLLRSSMELRL